MHFNSNEKGFHNNGLIYKNIERIDIFDVKKATTENGEPIDYLQFLSKKNCLKKIESVLSRHVINSQIVITNFADESDELINCEYMYETVLRNKMCFFLKNVYLSSFFTNDYMNYIRKNYNQTLLSLNCKYDNKIYMNNNFVYLCVNDLTKLRLTSHRNIYKDRFKQNHVVVLDICNEEKVNTTHDHVERKKCGTPNQKKGNEPGRNLNENIRNESSTQNKILGEMNFISHKLNQKKEDKKISDNLDKKWSTSISPKLRKKYEDFFTDIHTYPVDLLGLYNYGKDYKTFCERLKNVLTLNGSKDAEIYAVHVQCHECFYEESGYTSVLKNRTRDEVSPNKQSNVDNCYNIGNNPTNTLFSEFNMSNVADIYKNIFFNSSSNETAINVNSLTNFYNMYGLNNGDCDIIVSSSDSANNHARQTLGIKNELNYMDIPTRKNCNEEPLSYELNMNYIEKEFLSRIFPPPKETCEIMKKDYISLNDMDMCKYNGVVDIYDLISLNKSNKKKKVYNINGKTFYVNYKSCSSSEVSLSCIRSTNSGTTKGVTSNEQKGSNILNTSTRGKNLRDYVKGGYQKKEYFQNYGNKAWDDQCTQNFSQRENEKNKKVYNIKPRMGIKSIKTESSDLERAKLKKIDKVLNFLKKHKNYYYKNNERMLQREYLYKLVSNMSDADARSVTKRKEMPNETKWNREQKYDEFVSYLIEYIGKILLDIKINYKHNENMLIKKEKKFYKIQKIMFSNGIISNCTVRNVCNYLIGKLVNKKYRDKRKLCYVLSIFGQYYSFINSDKYSQETCSQVSSHLFFFSSPKTIYIMILNTQDRVL
ncbi:hypothetical protein, conserved [Plasmodium gonderi]|uniref:Uncharacterized protein n=1 Tax=Plasmodium gonderi TaxID=77519 RepID=A0A1Y1JGV8_PLAGO|nr:hypothetical protein, conserved [Plasmodium gonderi]GAW80888.1 hypothetical protein, conserved [Plasmodium gonderi]